MAKIIFFDDSQALPFAGPAMLADAIDVVPFKLGDGTFLKGFLAFLDTPFGQMILQLLLSGIGAGVKPADVVSAAKLGDGGFMKFLKESGLGAILLKLLLSQLTGGLATPAKASAAVVKPAAAKPRRAK